MLLDVMEAWRTVAFLEHRLSGCCGDVELKFL